MPASKNDPSGHELPALTAPCPLVSTRWVWRKVMITQSAGGPSDSPVGAALRRPVSARNARTPLVATLKSRGGAEAWVEVQARGQVFRFPGHVTIAEVVLKLNGLS